MTAEMPPEYQKQLCIKVIVGYVIDRVLRHSVHNNREEVIPLNIIVKCKHPREYVNHIDRNQAADKAREKAADHGVMPRTLVVEVQLDRVAEQIHTLKRIGEERLYSFHTMAVV